MRLDPIRSDAALGDQPHAQLGRVFHTAHDQLAHLFLLAAQHVDHQLVVHLQEDLGLQAPPAELARWTAIIAQLHDVGRPALYRRVHRIPLASARTTALPERMSAASAWRPNRVAT